MAETETYKEVYKSFYEELLSKYKNSLDKNSKRMDERHAQFIEYSKEANKLIDNLQNDYKKMRQERNHYADRTKRLEDILG